MATYVVAGVTGRVGSAVADELLSRGERVRVIVRDRARGHAWALRGADVANGSLDDRRFVYQTIRDAAGFFALLPENVDAEDFHGARRSMADQVAAAVRDSAAGAPHVVMLSAIAAVLPDGNGPAKDLHYCEQQLRRCARRLTILRACYFQENVAGALPVVTTAGVYPNFLASADAAIPMVATQDVGRFAARALLNPPTGHEVVDVLGPLYSIREVAQVLGETLGKPVQVIDVPAERHRTLLSEAGMPRPIADAVSELFAAFNAGLIRPQGDRQVVGTTPIDDVVRRYVASVTSAAAVTS